MKIALISMPWTYVNRPSIQIGVLKAYLQNQDSKITVSSYHPYLDVAKRIGTEAYCTISEEGWAGEAVYSALLFPTNKERCQKVFIKSLNHTLRKSIPDFDTLTALLNRQLDDWLEKIDLSDYLLAGFTVCFNQLPATLLAAQRLKKKFPNLPIVLGGSNCSAGIGKSFLNNFPFIDFIINGEGERPLLRLCKSIATNQKVTGQNIFHRQTNDNVYEAPSKNEPAFFEQISNLEELPLPDYDDYFKEMKQYGLHFITTLPIEFSRGCWWNKCAFCYLNLQWSGYRTKKAEKVLEETKILSKQYQSVDFMFTDCALPVAEADRFFKKNSSLANDLEFFAEIRLLKNPEDYTRFFQGGLRYCQIGIEAFSDPLLRHMNKGVTTMDNVAAMKYILQVGMELYANLILEFPGSTQEDVDETLRVLDFVLPYHPLNPSTFYLGQSSPIWRDPKKFNVTAIMNHPYDRQLYPTGIHEKLNLPMKYARGDRQYQRKIWRPVKKKLLRWDDFHKQRKSDEPILSYRDSGNFLVIRNELPGNPIRHHRLKDLSREIYLSCRTPVSIKTLLKLHTSITEDELITFLRNLEKKRLVFTSGKKWLALAVHKKK